MWKIPPPKWQYIETWHTLVQVLGNKVWDSVPSKLWKKIWKKLVFSEKKQSNGCHQTLYDFSWKYIKPSQFMFLVSLQIFTGFQSYVLLDFMIWFHLDMYYLVTMSLMISVVSGITQTINQVDLIWKNGEFSWKVQNTLNLVIEVSGLKLPPYLKQN